jgi:DNA-binding LacI/PurR family transcriptional regulator
MVAIREAGLKMPHEVALTGFDDTFAASVVTPQLSTVSQHQYAPGRHQDGAATSL